MANPKKYVKTMKNVMVEMKRSERKEPNSRYTYSYFMAKQINLLNERQYTNGNVVVARKINRQRVKSEWKRKTDDTPRAGVFLIDILRVLAAQTTKLRNTEIYNGTTGEWENVSNGTRKNPAKIINL